jgi:aspartyl-tRNA(Asn)/glutamyl-tRNA(Gln) amidotransferase subunit A
MAALIHALRAALCDGQVSPVTLAEQALTRIEDHHALNAIAFVEPARALEEARTMAREARAGWLRGPLHGLPITVKDVFNVRDTPLRAGARAPLPEITPDEATAVARLRQAGALILAKTNLQEIALGLTGENPWTGDVKNPHDPDRQAGGSSSGSAVAVAMGIGVGSLGSDTAGSIRLPASFCGVVGFKPSYGAIPLDGALPLVPSCDHAGPLARTVADVAALFAVLAGRPNDAWASAAPLPRPPRLVVPAAYLLGALTSEVRSAFELLIERLRLADALVDEVTLDIGDPLAGFAPLRAESVMIHRSALAAQPEAFSPPVREALMRGYDFSAVQYLHAREYQRVLREALHRALQGADALVLPAAPCVAPPRGTTEIALEAGPADLRTAILRLTLPAALAGLPALALPFARINSLPVALQIIAPFGADQQALAVGAWIEAWLDDREPVEIA